MTGRLPCCVPFCRRSRKDDGKFKEWICGIHWKPVPARLKWFKRAADRRVRSTFGLAAHERARADRAWARCKRAAIEAAGGIG
jgi:hypothetical protein